VLPAGFRLGDNDSRILSVALNFKAEGRDVTLVSKDLPMRVKASAVGLPAEEYRAELAVESGWTGLAELDIAGEDLDRLYDDGVVDHAAAAELPCHTGLVLLSERGSGLGRVTPDKRVRLVRGDREAFGLHGRSAEQRIALDLLLDPDVGIVSLGGRAGTGKSALALCAGLESVLERRQHRRVVVFRPLYAVGGQELGYLPGTEAEKMSPWRSRRPRSSRRSSTAACSRSCPSRTSAAVRCMTHSSSSTRRSRWSATSCSPSSPGSVRAHASSSPMTSPSATTSGSVDTTAWSRWSRSSRATRSSRT
jgi:hypothetical protein